MLEFRALWAWKIMQPTRGFTFFNFLVPYVYVSPVVFVLRAVICSLFCHGSFVHKWVVNAKAAKLRAKAAAAHLSFDQQCKHCEKVLRSFCCKHEPHNLCLNFIHLWQMNFLIWISYFLLIGKQSSSYPSNILVLSRLPGWVSLKAFYIYFRVFFCLKICGVGESNLWPWSW